jgi:hypothetical protein
MSQQKQILRFAQDDKGCRVEANCSDDTDDHDSPSK